MNKSYQTKDYPTWVLQHKVKGTEIRSIKGRYYLYQVKNFWDKESKRSKKVTEAFLGRIMELGLPNTTFFEKDPYFYLKIKYGYKSYPF